MCGIALILAGFRILGSDPFRESSGNPAAIPEEIVQVHELVVPVDDFKDALLRRGPDNLGTKTLFFHPKQKSSIENDDSEEDNKDDLCLCVRESVNDCLNSALKAVTAEGQSTMGTQSIAKLDLLGATLQLRGKCRVFQPLQDIPGNVLAYNGEIFGGIHVAVDGNDAETLLYALERCCSHDCDRLEMPHPCINPGENSVPEILSTIKGPWALVYWQERSKTIWFGRDALGRRSLLVHWPTTEDPRFILSSVSPPSFGRKDSECMPSYWEELPCGVFSIHLKASKNHHREEWLVGEVRKHDWTDPLFDKLIRWERTFVDPKLNGVSLDNFPSRKGLLPSVKRVHNDNDRGDIKENHMRMDTKLEAETSGSLLSDLTQVSPMIGYSQSQPAIKVLVSLRESVMRRTTLSPMIQMALHQCDGMESAPVAVLFSGGLDSMLLAALLDQCLDPNYAVDLLNVSFDGNLAPDRISARQGVRELQMVAPQRRWRLVEIDASLSSLMLETKHVTSLILPSRTYMDLNIGMALWLAAGGEGLVDGEICNHFQKDFGRHKYKSTARILLVGSGADEQCAGYGRHRTKYRLGGWSALQEEMKLDMQRIWKRNLGRDDRCISDHGKEARFPFLDEDVIRTLLEIPLWEIAELDEPIGRGDKKILREVAGILGLGGAACMPKRAIQFGTRIARESNRKNFGSNRAANQASAGSVEIHESAS